MRCANSRPDGLRGQPLSAREARMIDLFNDLTRRARTASLPETSLRTLQRARPEDLRAWIASDAGSARGICVLNPRRGGSYARRLSRRVRRTGCSGQLDLRPTPQGAERAESYDMLQTTDTTARVRVCGTLILFGARECQSSSSAKDAFRESRRRLNPIVTPPRRRRRGGNQRSVAQFSVALACCWPSLWPSCCSATPI